MNGLFHTSDVPGSPSSAFRFIMGHGWGQSGAAFRPLAEALQTVAPSTLIDFPGFGASPLPPVTWGTADYADALYEFLSGMHSSTQLIWVGHSFGGRVGLQLAARHPGVFSAMVLIAAAGLRRKRSPMQRAQIAARRIVYQTAKKFIRSEANLQKLRERMGSVDYRAAGAMRPILTRVVNEDLSQVAQAVSCPVLLIYGKEDTETPVEFGQRFQSLMPNAELVVLEGFGHLSILIDGRHQLSARIKRFVTSLAPAITTTS